MNCNGHSSKISDAEFSQFCDFIYEKTGIRFDQNKRYFVVSKLHERIITAGFIKFSDYWAYVTHSNSLNELESLINSITVNESYFWRENHQFSSMVEDVIPQFAMQYGASKKVFRIWSVPSAAGEEPFSIAIFLLENSHRYPNLQIEIMSSDIDTAVLEKCRQGIYSPRAVQHIPDSLRAKYFDFDQHSNTYHLVSRVKDMITFSRVNLTNEHEVRRFHGIDLIFCRNLLIYFDEGSKKRAVSLLFEALKPGGVIFLGHSESMSRISSKFVATRFEQSIGYQKPLAS